MTSWSTDIEANSSSKFRKKLFDIIFEADTKAGRAFDIFLIIMIFLSIFTVMLDTVKVLHSKYDIYFYYSEWAFTIFFTIEYIIRIYTVKTKSKYIFSFFGIVDFLSIVPTYLSIFIPGSQYLLTIRFLRVLRVFRILKLVQFVSEAKILVESLKRSSKKVLVFIMTVLVSVTIFGSFMYVIEGPGNNFTSIPASIYWAVVTLTTVGYGDIIPQTILGKTIASFIMVLGYGIIAVPTGIVTAELTQSYKRKNNTQVCRNCHDDEHEDHAKFCKSCGHSLL